MILAQTPQLRSMVSKYPLETFCQTKAALESLQSMASLGTSVWIKEIVSLTLPLVSTELVLVNKVTNLRGAISPA